MCCGEKRINLAKNQVATNRERGVTLGEPRLYIVKTPANPRLAHQTPGPRFREPIIGRYDNRRRGLHLV
jgi:hypothetical protein